MDGDGSRAPAAVGDWPLVGRADELGQLCDLVVGATGRGRRGAVVAGAWGVGKTRLARECLRFAERRGLVTVSVAATRAAARAPLGALAPLLMAECLPAVGAGSPPGGRPTARLRAARHRLVPGEGWAEGMGAAGELDRALRGFTDGDGGVDLLLCVANALAERAGGRRLVVFVDDAHLLDDASAALVHQLAAADAAFVLATVAAGEPAPDAVVALWKEGLADRVELGVLPDETVEELVSIAVGGPVDPGTAAELTARCRGNVLLLRELVTAARQDGVLVDEDGAGRRLRGTLAPSPRLIELVETRLGDLDAGERSVLELVSLGGGTLGQAELTDLADPAVVEALERRGVLASRTNGRRLEVSLAHPVYAEVIRSGIPALRARAIARSLAEAMEATGARRRHDALWVASWRLTAGGGRPETLLAGAVAARECYDYRLAERLARAAVDAGAGFDAALLTAELAAQRGHVAQAERALAELAKRASDDTQRGLVALARINNSVTRAGTDLRRVFDEAEATIGDLAWRGDLQARRLGLILDTDGPQAAADAATPLLRARGRALAFACVTGAYSLARLGRIDAALEVVARGEAAQRASRTALTWFPWWHAVNRCLALNYGGRLKEAQVLAVQHHRRAVADGAKDAQAAFAIVSAMAVGERGRVRTAARRAGEALGLCRRAGRTSSVRSCLIVRALAFALAGRATDAERSLAELDTLGLPVMRRDEVELALARAWTAAAAGHIAPALRRLEEAADLGDDIGDVVGQAAALHGLARLGRANDVGDRLAAVITQIDGALAPARLAHTEALARGDAAGLEAVSGTFEAMGADLLAAEAAADAAVARRRAGETREATAAERRAGVLAERCEGAATPALQAIEARAQLTRAERETALLAAAGRSNKQIAAELYVSVRTVENHLQHVYTKLGIAGRTELAEVLAACSRGSTR